MRDVTTAHARAALAAAAIRARAGKRAYRAAAGTEAQLQRRSPAVADGANGVIAERRVCAQCNVGVPGPRSAQINGSRAGRHDLLLLDTLSMATASARVLAADSHGWARLQMRDGDSRTRPGHRHGADRLRHLDGHSWCRLAAVPRAGCTENYRDRDRDDQRQAERRDDRQQALRQRPAPRSFAVAPARPLSLRSYHAVDGRPGRRAPK